MGQMKVLRFTLSGKQAFFKKPEVNKYYYFTYGHIHRVALLGLLGAVMGYSGYAQIGQKKQTDVPEYPEFYQQLQDLKTAVIPCCEKGSFPQKMIAFNNSVGYASMEKGGNLIVRQQWLENPKWYVYIMLDSEAAEAVADSIIGRKSVYMPYLGSNDHPADITDARMIDATEVEAPERIDSFLYGEMQWWI